MVSMINMYKVFKFLSSAFILSILAVTVKALNNPIGSLTDAQNDSDDKFVYNQDQVSHGVGSVMTYVTTSPTYTGLSVSTTTTANNSLVAGVVIGNTCPASSWCYIRTFGYYPAVKVAVATSAGNLLTPSTTAESACLTRHNQQYNAR